uniref:Elicitin n=1 Tax=Globisporangium ultimum (strain ATCC 200006 / CBS 805.95 / DAOM BR144) TaxID=431595 RepID=K3WH19_GLOUD
MATRMLSFVALTVLLLVAAVPTPSLAVNATNATSDASSSSTTTDSTQCDEELLFQKLYVLMPAINQCAKESDYYINTDALALPTNESLTKFCTSENCTRLSDELDDAGLPSCTVAVGAAHMSFKELFNQMRAYCVSTNTKPSSTSKSAAGSVILAANGWEPIAAATLAVLAMTINVWM